MTTAAAVRSCTSMTSSLGRLRRSETDATQGFASRRCATPPSSTLKSVEPSGTAASCEMSSLERCSVGLHVMRLISKMGENTTTT